MMTMARYWILPLVLWLASCGGKTPAPAPEPPPPPVDENLLNLAPYEADMLIWLDMTKLRASEIWPLAEKVMGAEGMGIPLNASLRSPLLACDEILMAFFENDTVGPQLLIVAKGDPSHATALTTAFSQNAKVEHLTVDGIEAMRAAKVMMVPLTERTVVFGNGGIVRLSAKASAGTGRPITKNDKFGDFETGGTPAAKLRYRSGIATPVAETLKTVAPRVKPDAVTGLDAVVHVAQGFVLDIDIATQTQMDASVIAEDLKRAKRELKNNMFVLFLGISWMLDRIQVASEKTDIKLNVTLDSRDITELGHLVERLQKIQELLDDSGGPPLNNPMKLPQ